MLASGGVYQFSATGERTVGSTGRVPGVVTGSETG